MCYTSLFLNVYKEKKKQRAPPVAAPNDLPIEREPYDDGWLGYEEPVFEF
ncbi:MAG: hypothetical protein GY702_18725 [Desulfobulbaceae bacterium]|nr:hypothetical protein [Desulfobulbaceae bacterium]